VRIFVDPAQLQAGELVIRADEHHYIARVRRARRGDPVELVDGAGRRAAAVIAKITEAETTLIVSAPEKIVARPPLVRALVPLIKRDRMDICLEKLVEVGADVIVVWPAARSVVRLDQDRRGTRLAKYNATVQAAARQCGRSQIPTVQLVEDLAPALATLPPGIRLVLDPGAERPLAVGEAADVTIASGPEGGLTAEELTDFELAGFTAVGMGPRILRAETAPVIAVALVRAATAS
jgi:16S rRNA (uracil1498-N3)-methyltransferase